MIFLFNLDSNKDKLISYSLIKVFGLNNTLSNNICKYLGFSKNFKVKNLTNDHINLIANYLNNSNILVNQDLKKKLSVLKKDVIKLKSYKSYRILYKLPVRGQRTHTNSKTCKNL
jgi:small subunit ribosomal protein S13